MSNESSIYLETCEQCQWQVLYKDGRVLAFNHEEEDGIWTMAGGLSPDDYVTFEEFIKGYME